MIHPLTMTIMAPIGQALKPVPISYGLRVHIIFRIIIKHGDIKAKSSTSTPINSKSPTLLLINKSLVGNNKTLLSFQDSDHKQSIRQCLLILSIIYNWRSMTLRKMDCLASGQRNHFTLLHNLKATLSNGLLIILEFITPLNIDF